MKILFNGFRHGHINTLYKKVLNSEFAEIVGCVEDNEKARSAAKKNLGAHFTDKSYSEWLCEDFDTVAIGTVYGERGAAIIEALKAGKHVISDKPICTSLDELYEIKRLASEKDLTVACMLDLRYLPVTLKAKELLDSGYLGEVKNIAFGGQHFLDCAHRPEWYFEDGKHGGTVNDLAIHGIDLVRMLTGLEFSKIDAARVWNSYAYKSKDFKDSALFMARLENGAGVMADISYSAPSQVFSMPTYWEFRFWCERGLLTFCYAKSEVTVYEDGKTAPTVYSCGEATEDYLTEFAEREGMGKQITENVIRSTETALLIQKEADKEQSV